MASSTTHSSDSATYYEFAEALLACASQFSEFSPDAVQFNGSRRRLVPNRSLNCNKIRNTFAIEAGALAWRNCRQCEAVLRQATTTGVRSIYGKPQNDEQARPLAVAVLTVPIPAPRRPTPPGSTWWTPSPLRGYRRGQGHCD